MNSLYKTVGLIGLIFIMTSSQILAETTFHETPVHYDLGHAAMSQNIILRPPNNTATPNIFPNYVFIDPTTETVIVKPHPRTFTKEIKTFKSHRLHYITFWGLFFLMRGTQWGK